MISAQGSAGRRTKLGVGTESRHDANGEALYDARDAAAMLGLTQSDVERMMQVGTMMALARLFGLPVRDQPGASCLVPVVDADGNRWVTDTELSRCEDALYTGTTRADIAATGPLNELLPLSQAARLAGVTRQYLGRVARRYASDKARIDATLAEGRIPRQAYLTAERGTRSRWFVTRGELAAFLERRRPPAVRVAYDLTLTTEKSLSVLALLSSDDDTRQAVLGAIQVGNAWALRLEALSARVT